MSSTVSNPLPLLICPSCNGSGTEAARPCPECRGLAVGVKRGKSFYYWGSPLNRSRIVARKAGAAFQAIITAGVMLAAVALIVLTFSQAYLSPDPYISSPNFFYQRQYNRLPNLSGPLKDYVFAQARDIPSSVWLALLIFLFFISRLMRNRPRALTFDHLRGSFAMADEDESQHAEEISWAEARRLKKKHKIDISKFYSDHAIKTLESALKRAGQKGRSELNNFEVFLLLLNVASVKNVLGRFGLNAKSIRGALDKLRPKKAARTVPQAAPALWQALFDAFFAAEQSSVSRVGSTDLFEAIVQQDEKLQEVFHDLDVDAPTLKHAVSWVRLQGQILDRWQRFRGHASARPKGETNRAMTAVVTQFLDRYSRDLTHLAIRGALDFCVGREKEIEELFRVFTSGGHGVVLVGHPGVGKNTIIEGVAELMINEDVPEIMYDKRLVELHTPSLLAGASAAEAEERLLHCLYEIERSGNIILVVPNIEQLIGITAGREESLDLADVLANEMERTGVLVIATTDHEAYRQTVSATPLMGRFQKVEVEEADEDLTLAVLESKTNFIEYKNKVYFSFAALQKAYDLSARFLPDLYLPEKAVELITEVGVAVRNKHGRGALIGHEDVAKIVAQKTKVPLEAVTEDESEKLLRLEEAMHERVIGQDEAVKLVADALRRARAGVRSTKRPIANFLFLGPTGVGKTETAKTIAEVYFGKEDMMVRLDMSEYQDKNSIYRLIGTPGARASGVLTEAVRQVPASLVLLDELEKADPNVLNIFLQVMDDGRLTDSTGQVVDFTNTIIIATSNAGTSFVQEEIGKGTAMEEIRKQLLHGGLSQYFRPEFLNRFDGIVVFKPLEAGEVTQIARLSLKSVADMLESRGIKLIVTDEGLNDIAAQGFDPQFGARPLRRVIQDKIEAPIAELLLKKEAQRKDTIVVAAGGEVRVEHS